MKGVALVLLTVVATAVISPIVFMTVGEGMSPPGPIPSHYVVIVGADDVLAGDHDGRWPFTKMTSNPLVSGLLMLVAAYVVTYVVFRIFFNYDFLQGAPVYLQSAPQRDVQRRVGAGLLCHGARRHVSRALLRPVAADALPRRHEAACARRRVDGHRAGGAALAMSIGVNAPGADPMAFLTQVTVPFIFGSIIVLNMLQNSLFARMAQPLKGVMNTDRGGGDRTRPRATCNLASADGDGSAAVGTAGIRARDLAGQRPLGVTFPFLIYHAVFFGYWPLVRSSRRYVAQGWRSSVGYEEFR